MKKYLHFLFLSFLTLSIYAQQEYKGRLTIYFPNKSIEGSVVLYSYNTPIDSALVKDGKYTYRYTHTKDETNMAISPYFCPKGGKYQDISVRNPYINARYVGIYLDNKDIVIRVDSFISKNSSWVGTIGGSVETDLSFQLMSPMLELKYCPRMHASLYRATLQSPINNFDIIRDNPSSMIVLSNINSERNYYTLDSLSLAYSLFDKSVQQSEKGKSLKSFIENQKKFTSVGLSKSFQFYDVQGKSYNFEQFIDKKKIGLMVFWASWCGPCIAEIPVLAELYKKYKDKVAFVSLTVDKDREKWMKALKAHPMDWLTLSGFSKDGKKNTTNEIFDPSWIPCFLLVDKDGQILVDQQKGKEVGVDQKRKIEITELEDLIKKYLGK